MSTSPTCALRAAAPLRQIAPLPAPAADHIGVEPFAVGDVPYLHPFALDQIGRLHQLLVDGDASHVIEVRLGNGHPMDFRFQYFDLHHPLRII